MGFSSFESGHKFGPYKISLDEKTSKLYSKAIINRDINNHTPFAIVSITFGKLLKDVELEEGAIHLSQSIKWEKIFDEKQKIIAIPKIESKTERKNNIFIKIKIYYSDESNIKLGESISTILIASEGG
ncbi:MAG: hypothetical protein ACJ0J5_06605 [Dehalococcoidia bacterium]|jgi:hypothetical protein|nr:hypothetical protein [Chloroflexota bacterium]RZP13610.1 MAG: hypothetical protein EVA32_02885 [Chloroflexota bacterium]|tara:strand:- start:8391 stop:8774 length:384 start_codon:yes stop_codon:yes gene_type:complete